MGLKDYVTPLRLGWGKREWKVDAVTGIFLPQLDRIELCLG